MDWATHSLGQLQRRRCFSPVFCSGRDTTPFEPAHSCPTVELPRLNGKERAYNEPDVTSHSEFLFLSKARCIALLWVRRVYFYLSLDGFVISSQKRPSLIDDRYELSGACYYFYCRTAVTTECLFGIRLSPRIVIISDHRLIIVSAVPLWSIQKLIASTLLLLLRKSDADARNFSPNASVSGGHNKKKSRILNLKNRKTLVTEFTRSRRCCQLLG